MEERRSLLALTTGFPGTRLTRAYSAVVAYGYEGWKGSPYRRNLEVGMRNGERGSRNGEQEGKRPPPSEF